MSGFDEKGFTFGSDDAADAEPKEGTVVNSGASDDSHDSETSILDFLARVNSILDDDEDDSVDDLSVDNLNANEIHNKAINYARRGETQTAKEICKKGLEKFTNNVDLLADTVKYASECGEMAEAKRHYELLKSIPFTSWNWRAFTFTFDYLLGEDPVGNKEECRSVVSNFMRVLPYEQRAYMAASELELALGNAEEAMAVLEKAVHTLANAAQCALKLADMQLDRGLYEDALKTALYGIAATETQPSINAPYLLYVCALARDHALHQKVLNGLPVTQDEVNALERQYSSLAGFDELIRYRSNIKQRARMLELIEVR